MTTLIKQLLGFLILTLFSSALLAGSVTKCVDAAGNITFTTMGCKTSETDIKAVEEAKARAAAEEKAKAEAQAEEEAAMKRVTGTKASTSSESSSNSTTTSTSNGSAESSNTSSPTAVQNDGTDKVGTRGSVGGDLTVGYQ